jgi:copper ion binding protein
MTTTRTAFRVRGMTCENCVRHVTKAVQKVPGVTDPQVDLARGRVELTFDATQGDARAIVEAITKAGYTAEPEAPGHA